MKDGWEKIIATFRGAIKNWFFLLSVKRGGGALANPNYPYQKIPKGGESHPIQKGFIRFFGIICQKMGVLYKKKTGSFLTIFRRKGGGGLAQSKKSLSEKTEVVKKGGGGGGSQFFDSK